MSQHYTRPLDGVSPPGDAEEDWTNYPNEDQSSYQFNPSLGPPLYIVTSRDVLPNQGNTHWSAEGNTSLTGLPGRRSSVVDGSLGPQSRSSPYPQPAHSYSAEGLRQHPQYTTVLPAAMEVMGGTFSHPAGMPRHLANDGSQSPAPLRFDAPPGRQSFSVWGGEVPTQEQLVPSQPGHPSFQSPVPGGSHFSLEQQRLYAPGPHLIARDQFIEDSFPLQNEDHFKKRSDLYAVMNSEWKIKNEMEPNEQLLLQFMTHDRQEGRWLCCFWELGRPCGKSFRPKDHAKGHIRTHLKHLPYACTQPCPAMDPHCDKRYTAAEHLSKHRKGRVECERCGMSMLLSNVARHRETACRARTNI